MTIEELCGLFSEEIDSTFYKSKDEITEQIFIGTTMEMTEEEVFAKMIINSMRISANLAVQPMLAGLVQLGVIPKDALAKIRLKPKIHLVKEPEEPEPVGEKEKKKIKVVKELTEEQRKKIQERLKQK